MKLLVEPKVDHIAAGSTVIVISSPDLKLWCKVKEKLCQSHVDGDCCLCLLSHGWRLLPVSHHVDGDCCLCLTSHVDGDCCLCLSNHVNWDCCLSLKLLFYSNKTSVIILLLLWFVPSQMLRWSTSLWSNDIICILRNVFHLVKGQGCW